MQKSQNNLLIQCLKIKRRTQIPKKHKDTQASFFQDLKPNAKLPLMTGNLDHL